MDSSELLVLSFLMGNLKGCLGESAAWVGNCSPSEKHLGGNRVWGVRFFPPLPIRFVSRADYQPLSFPIAFTLSRAERNAAGEQMAGGGQK